MTEDEQNSIDNTILEKRLEIEKQLDYTNFLIKNYKILKRVTLLGSVSFVVFIMFVIYQFVDIKKQYSYLEQYSEILTETFPKARDESVRLNAENQKLTGELKLLENDIERKKDYLNKVNQEISNQEEILEIAKKEISNYESIKDVLPNLKKQQANLEDEIRQLSKENKDLLSEKNKLTIEVKRLTSKEEELNAKIVGNRNALDSLQKDLEEVGGIYLSKLKIFKENINKEEENLSEALTNFKSKLDSGMYTDVVNSFKADLEKTSSLAQKDLKVAIGEVSTQFKQLKDDQESLLKESLSQAVKSITDNLNSLLSNIDKSISQSIKSINDYNDNLADSVKTLTGIISNLTNNNIKLESALSSNDSALKELELINTQLQDTLVKFKSFVESGNMANFSKEINSISIELSHLSSELKKNSLSKIESLNKEAARNTNEINKD